MSTAPLPADPQLVEETTALALKEKGHLVKSLRRVDMFLLTVCAFVGLDTLGLMASNGSQGKAFSHPAYSSTTTSAHPVRLQQ